MGINGLGYGINGSNRINRLLNFRRIPWIVLIKPVLCIIWLKSNHAEVISNVKIQLISAASDNAK